jgi:methylated-DNA-[protein]-cysteine S-methyltransferase
MSTTQQHDCLAVFETALGWIAMIGSGKTLKLLTFGHRTAEAARGGTGVSPVLRQKHGQDARATHRKEPWNPRLVEMLQAYATGRPVDFRCVEVDLGEASEFRRRVVRHCREIPFGKTQTYGKLAAKAGYPGAARAVGNCMAANRIPLVIPCHRVVAADGSLGGFSAPGGIRLKQRLLELESGRPAP